MAQKGLSIGKIESKYFAPVILQKINSSMIVPVLLKNAFHGETPVLLTETN